MGSLLDFNSQRLNHLINGSKWDELKLMDSIAHNFMNLLSDNNLADDVSLLIDESGFTKKGKKSAGVKHQYNGQAGKLDNCQVGVFGALNAGSLTSIIKSFLHIAQEGKTKIDLAKDIINHAVFKLKIIPKCINADAFYGRDTALLAYINSKNLKFIFDVPEGHKIYLEPFQMRVPKSKSTRGRKATLPRPNKESISIKQYASTLKKNDYKQISIRHGSNGKLKAKFHRRVVYLLNPTTNKRIEFTLFIRIDKDGKRYYCLTNFTESTPLKEVAYLQSKRYFIERAFQDGKKNLGMRQYESRSKQAWLRHITLCMLALLFIQHEKMHLYKTASFYISAEDVKKIFAVMVESTQKIITKTIKDIVEKCSASMAFAKYKIYLRI